MSAQPHKHDRIKDMLTIWAGIYRYRAEGGYPASSAFANERVQSSASCDAYVPTVPADILMLNGFIESLAPTFKRIISLEYFDKRPTKTKAHICGIPRQVFAQRVNWAHEQLTYDMWSI